MSPTVGCSKERPTSDQTSIRGLVVRETHVALDALRAPLGRGLELESSLEAFVASLFLIRCSRNLAAVLALCTAGWAPEAQTLLRAMIEDVVTVSYISTSPEKLARKWLTFENERIPDPDELLAIFSGDDPPKHKQRPKYKRWTRLGISSMAERAESVVPGLAGYLEYVYPILSDRAHGNTSASSIYMRVHPTGELEPLYLPSERQVTVTLCNAVTAAYTTAERARALGVTVDIAPLEQAQKRIYEACGLTMGQ